MKLFSRASVGCIGKSLSLLLIVLLTLSSSMMTEPAFAQTPTSSPAPKSTPSVPEFTVQLVGPSYTQPTTYQLNQKTGLVVATIGYTNEYSDIQVTIKNQPLAFNYPAPTLIGGFGFYYNIQVRPHSSSGDWTDVYHAWGDGYLVSTNTEYTITSLSIEGYGFEGSQTDIQVQAMIGQIGWGYNPNASQIDMYPYKFEGQTSSWSPTQTVTVPANTPLSSTPISSFSPTVNAYTSP